MATTTVQQIKDKLNIADIISGYIKLEKNGINFKARCPFHNEKTPSFFISPDRGSYYCFGCGAKGDMFTFVEQFEGLDFKGALRVLADRAGVAITFDPGASKEESKKEKLFLIMEKACTFFENNLKKNSEAKNYLLKRGLKEETIKDFRLGFVGLNWNDLYNYLRQEKFSNDLIVEAGLAKISEKGTHYDRFRDRIIFPITDSGDRVIAFTGRIIHETGKEAKYLNSPETPLYHKSHVLYGLSKAKETIRQRDYVIMVEGQMDLILCHQRGIKNIVAASGTALTEETNDQNGLATNLGLVRRLTSNILICFDGDSAGKKATLRASGIALSIGMYVKVASLPEGLDPADLAQKDPDKLKESLKDARSIILFALDLAMGNGEIKDREKAKRIKEIVFPFVLRIQSLLERAQAIKEITKKTGFSDDVLWQELKNYEKDIKKDISPNDSLNNKKTEINKETDSPEDLVLERIWGILKFHSQKVEKQDLFLSYSKRLSALYGNYWLDKQNILVQKEDKLIFNNGIQELGQNIETKELEELFLRLEEFILKRDFGEAMIRVGIAEKSFQKDLASKALLECHEITRRINELNRRRNMINEDIPK